MRFRVRDPERNQVFSADTEEELDAIMTLGWHEMFAQTPDGEVLVATHDPGEPIHWLVEFES
jgi:hypothetical protein